MAIRELSASSHRDTSRYETTRSFGDRPRIAINTEWLSLKPSRADGLVLVCGRDLTEQRQVEEALPQSQKMEAIGQLTGGIAHDFKNPLAAVIGSVELMDGGSCKAKSNSAV